MKKLLQTMAAVMLAATMVPVCADEPTVHIVIEPQKNENEVDSAAAWAHGITRAAGIGGSVAVGMVASAALGNPLPFMFSIPCTWIWASCMDGADHIFNMNWQTKQRADMINGRLSFGIMLLGLAAAMCTGIERVALPLPK